MLGIVVALPAECRTLSRQASHVGQTIPLSPTLRLRIAGMGAERAVAAAAALHREGVSAILNWGCAAALTPELKPGRLLLPDCFLLPGKDQVGADPRWWRRLKNLLADLSPCTASLAGSTTVLATTAEKRRLQQETNAAAADMESAFLAAWSRDNGLPFAAIRAVADDAETVVPATVLTASDPTGDIDLPRLLFQLLRRPGQLLPLLRLGRCFSAARATLSAAADRLHPAGFCLP